MTFQIGERKWMNKTGLPRTAVRIEAVMDDGQIKVSWPKHGHVIGRWVTTLDPTLLAEITDPPSRPSPDKDSAYDYVPLWSAIPPLYSTENIPMAEQVVHLKLFAPSLTWYLTEFSAVAPDGTPWLAFGYVRNDAETYYSEWGFIALDELRDWACPPLGLPIERDVYWEPTPFGFICF